MSTVRAIPLPASAATPAPRRLRAPLLLCGAALAAVVLLVAWKALHLAGYPLWVPMNYQEGDVIVMLMYIKGVVQDGWPLTISHLSAPFGYPAPAFPMQTSTDWLLIKGMAVFTREPGLLLNAFWLATAVMSAWSCAYATWQLRLSGLLACVAGVLYAFLPFALMRFTHHLNLVYYMVPLHCLLAALIAGGPELLRNPGQARVLGLAACVLQGFDYVYFSFFAVLLFGIAAMIAWRRAGWRQLRLPLAAAALVTCATALNLVPSLLSWQHEGRPPEMGYKQVAEAEIYGVKLRRLLLPHADNPLRPLAAYVARDTRANFPLENENQTARLGLFGAFGMLLMLILRVRARGEGMHARALDIVSGLGLATFLVITVGGFGAIINVLSVPDIRGYNRFSVFLSFFALATAALWLDARLPRPAGPAAPDGPPPPSRRRARVAALCAIVLLAAFSLRDQLYDARPFLRSQSDNVARARQERAAVERLEAQLPAESAVLQLPFTGYPPISSFENMLSYDHGRYSLWSHRLRWSWPSFSARHRIWQNRLAGLQGQDLLDAATLSGFSAIWIDRRAYKDRGAALVASLSQAGVQALDVGNPDLAVLDVRAATAQQRQRLGDAAFNEQARQLLQAGAVPEPGAGFYDEEHAPDGSPFRWSQAQSTLKLRNLNAQPIGVCVSFRLAVPNGGTVRVAARGLDQAFSAESAARQVRFPVQLEGREVLALRLATTAGAMRAPGDPRKLHFYVMDLRVGAPHSGPGPVCTPE